MNGFLIVFYICDMFSDLWNAIVREGWNGPLSFPSHLGTFGHDSRPLIGWWPSFPAIGWTITVLLGYWWKNFFFTLWLVGLGQQPSHNTFKKEQFVRLRQQKTVFSVTICTTFKIFIEWTALRNWVYFTKCGPSMVIPLIWSSSWLCILMQKQSAKE
jgi:hypothetical protein